MRYTAKSIINEKWYYCILFSFVCFIFLYLYRDHTNQQIITIVSSFHNGVSSDYNHYLHPKSNNISMNTMFNSCNVTSGCTNSTKGATIPGNTTANIEREIDSASEKIKGEELKEKKIKGEELKEKKCDIFDGEWVYDPERSPMYGAYQCPFLSDQVSCRKNGRPDSDYEHWRWQPRDCDIPRFNSTHMLEKMRGKRVAIIGDSLNRIQWESLACLIYPSLKVGRVKFVPDNLLKALDYDFSLEFYWSPFVVQVEQMKNGSKVLQLDSLDRAKKFQNADVLIFNTGHWWTHQGRSRTWSFYKHFGKLVEEMEEHSAFEIAMKTWASWVEKAVNPKKTTVFFRSISPEHKIENLHWCYNQTQPITHETYKKSFPASMVSTVEETIKNMKAPIKYLNITRLSEYRRDAHTSVYTVRQGKLLTESERKQPDLYADCSHWCLPGLPDTWNSLIYASVIDNLF